MKASAVRRACAGLLAVALVSCRPATPQEPVRKAAPQATIRAEVALVNVIFTVVDRQSRPVSGLRAGDFMVFEDRVPQVVEYFSQYDETSEVLLNVALLVDTSGSVKGKIEYEKDTAAEFFRANLRKDKDLGLLMQFDSEVNLVQDWTSDYRRLIEGLDTLVPGNSTALYDAVFLAVEEKLKGEVGRKVIVVISDGEDTSSRVRREEAIEAAQKSDVLIYGIGVRGDFGANFGVLKKMAESTGGSFFSPRARPDEIAAAFRAIGRELRSQYSLAYRSTNTRKDGAFRTIDIRPGNSGLKVKARRGYYAPRER